MRLPRLRLTVRRMMIAVAVVCVVASIAGPALRYRNLSAYYLEKASAHGESSRRHVREWSRRDAQAQALLQRLMNINVPADDSVANPSPITDRERQMSREDIAQGQLERERLHDQMRKLLIEAAPFHRKANHYGALSSKYAYAARQPWLPIEADPPEPK